MNVDPGNTISCRVDWTDTNGSVGLPGVVHFITRNPSGVFASYSLSGGSVIAVGSGAFEAYPVPVVEGAWRYRWVATTSFLGAKEGAFRVNESPFLP